MCRSLGEALREVILVIDRSCNNSQHSKVLLAELAEEDQVVLVPGIIRVGAILKKKIKKITDLQEQHDTGKLRRSASCGNPSVSAEAAYVEKPAALATVCCCFGCEQQGVSQRCHIFAVDKSVQVDHSRNGKLLQPLC